MSTTTPYGNKENNHASASASVGAGATKTPLPGGGGGLRRQALGNITNKTPKTGGKGKGLGERGGGGGGGRRPAAKVPFGEVKTPKASATSHLSQLTLKTSSSKAARPSASIPKGTLSTKKQQSASASANAERKEVSGSDLLAKEIERRAHIFAEEGVEFWMGDSFEVQERKKEEAESRQVRQNADNLKHFMKGTRLYTSEDEDNALAAPPQREECGDVAPCSFEDMSEEEMGDIESLLADTAGDEGVLL